MNNLLSTEDNKGIYVRKIDLVKLLAEDLSLTLKDSTEIVNYVFDKIAEALADGEEYHHSGFGILEIIQRKACRMHNVRKGEFTVVPKRNSVRFTTSKILKKKINQG